MTEHDRLEAADFAAFYRQLHGRDPHRWQQRAAGALAAGEVWDALSAPTGAGKTTLIDCFLFALAVSVDDPARRLPRRLFWVIDRRSVVDAVYDYATRVCAALDRSSDAPAAVVGARLRRLGGGEAVQVRIWRGGLADDVAIDGPRAALSAAACAVVCSTVDQVGSRMLFGGYGVSRRSRPIAAALCATDCVIVLDEAHLSRPFLDTARCVARVQAPRVGAAGPRVVSVSATQHAAPVRGFELTGEELGEPALARRVTARKLARLAHGSEETAIVREARRLAGEGAVVVGVVANTVSLARRAFERLGQHGDALLVIGPCRPIDREGLIARIPGRDARAGRSAALFVVGTQTLEVGLDLDFDALVTTCAPFAALVQRFGRLDRAGALGTSHAAIVAAPRWCPVYGESTAATWAWLGDHASDGVVDLGPGAAARLAAADPPASPAPPLAPILAPWHVEVLAQTSHDPVPSPEVGIFLHGEAALDAADVQVCWRADLNPADLGDDPLAEGWAERVRLRRPRAGELVSLPLPAVRRWLSRGEEIAFGDVESVAPDAAADTGGKRALRVPPPDADGVVQPELVEARQLAPGDLLVVPAAYGGCDAFGWAPASTRAVSDLGNLDAGGGAVLIAPALGAPPGVAALAADLADAIQRDDASSEEAYGACVETVRAWLAAGAGFEPHSGAGSAAARTAERLSTRGRALPIGEGGELLLTPRPASGTRASSRQVAYAEHATAVEDQAGMLAQCVLDHAGLGHTVRFAARHHDAGKLDPRFQAWLGGGAVADPDRPLAKSGLPPNDPTARRARQAAGWPAGKRHEATSAALLDAAPTLPADVDRDLLLHLVAVHHGDGRPFTRIAPDPHPVDVSAEIEKAHVTVSSNDALPWHEHAERWVRLNARFGPWGLALLESLLVLADREVSAREGTS